MNLKKTYLYVIALLALTSVLCQRVAPEEVSLVPTPNRSTATTVLEVPVLPTVTEIPPTVEPSIIIQLSKSKMVDPIGLVVVKGKYRLVNGTELWEGSNVSVQEDWMTFPSGMAIHVGEGGVMLKGKSYPDGTQLIVGADGSLVETTDAASMPSINASLPTITPLPEGIIFRDDFEGELQAGWEWQNENPDKWEITNDGWLQIIGEYDSLLGENRQKNLLWYPLPAGDFVVTAHLRAMPFENFQQATIYIYEDPENYVAINRGYCDLCSTGGGGFYMEYKISGDWGSYNAATDSEDSYLKLESMDNVISGYYATKPDEWVRLGRFGNYFQFKKVGIGVTNVRAANDVVGLFDYFEISLP